MENKYNEEENNRKEDVLASNLDESDEKDELSELLIEEVKKYRILWDTNSEIIKI